VSTHRPSDRPSRIPGDNAPQDCRILIAVGDLHAGEVIHGALSPLSREVDLVSSAAETIAEMERREPTLLVVDDDLPLVRGLDVAGRIRAERADVDVILLTADPQTHSIVNRLRIERLRCLEKPCDLEQLRQAAGVALEALALRVTGASYEDLVSHIEQQGDRFEERLRTLERRRGRRHAEPAPDSEPEPEPDSDATPSSEELPDGLRVLVVDDDPLVRRAMKRALRKQRVTTAENGLAATRQLEHARPDVIVSDLRMPEMDGLALAEEVKKRWPELADRIVFVSGADPQIERARVESPEQPVLHKPIDGQALESRIAEVLERAMRSGRGRPT
jgi:DNA-binding NtrC family response regulator